MRKTCLLRSLALTTAAAFGLPILPATPQTTDAPPALFTAATQQRAQALLAKMTTEEKFGQLTQLFVFAQSSDVDARIRAGRLGSALFVTDPKQINRLQHLAVDQSRLQIRCFTLPLLLQIPASVDRTRLPNSIPISSGAGPAVLRELKGFARVHLAAHTQQTLHFTVTPQDLQYWSAADHGWVQDAADFDLWVGADAAAPLHAAFHRTAAR